MIFNNTQRSHKITGLLLFVEIEINKKKAEKKKLRRKVRKTVINKMSLDFLWEKSEGCTNCLALFFLYETIYVSRFLPLSYYTTQTTKLSQVIINGKNNKCKAKI